MNEAATTTKPQHKFELSGFGKAPFMVVGHEVSVYVACPGAPAQPGSSCDYCGNGIQNVFWILSSDNKKFKVGSECVRKTGDKGLVNHVKRVEAKLNTQKRKTRSASKIQEGWEVMKKVIADQARNPHPNSYYASQGKTNADYLQFMWDNSGDAGKLKLLKFWVDTNPKAMEL